jgi:hypothetical protein
MTSEVVYAFFVPYDDNDLEIHFNFKHVFLKLDDIQIIEGKIVIATREPPIFKNTADDFLFFSHLIEKVLLYV